MIKTVIFDTETNGLPKSHNAPVTDTENYPRITQFAWIAVHDNGHEEEFSFRIKPDGWEVPKTDFFIKNGNTTERCEAEGVPIRDVLVLFAEHVGQAKTIVAHNIAFDYTVVVCEFIRYGIKGNGNKPTKFCTMQSTIEMCAIPGPYGFKYPKLTELHFHLFGEHFKGAHDAMNDVRACYKCYVELTKKQKVR